MRHSLVVTTYDWPDALDLVLASALHQTELPGEVIVADDGSGEPTAEVVRRFAPRFGRQGVALHHVWHADEGFRAAAKRVNGFNERFVGWGREDSEFVARLVNAGVRRRKLKFGGIMYHLWHPERPRDALDTNDALLDAVRRANAVRAEDGMDKYGR